MTFTWSSLLPADYLFHRSEHDLGADKQPVFLHGRVVTWLKKRVPDQLQGMAAVAHRTTDDATTREARVMHAVEGGVVRIPEPAQESGRWSTRHDDASSPPPVPPKSPRHQPTHRAVDPRLQGQSDSRPRAPVASSPLGAPAQSHVVTADFAAARSVVRYDLNTHLPIDRGGDAGPGEARDTDATPALSWLDLSDGLRMDLTSRYPVLHDAVNEWIAQQDPATLQALRWLDALPAAQQTPCLEQAARDPLRLLGAWLAERPSVQQRVAALQGGSAELTTTGVIAQALREAVAGEMGATGSTLVTHQPGVLAALCAAVAEQVAPQLGVQVANPPPSLAELLDELTGRPRLRMFVANALRQNDTGTLSLLAAFDAQPKTRQRTLLAQRIGDDPTRLQAACVLAREGSSQL